jgi:hypothetical protein
MTTILLDLLIFAGGSLFSVVVMACFVAASAPDREALFADLGNRPADRGKG